MSTKTLKIPAQLFRSATGAMTGEGDKKEFKMSISSDTPYKRYDWMADEEYWEVLSHEPGGMDTSRIAAGLPILFNHDRDQHLGRATTHTIDGKKCEVGGMLWSESAFAQEKKADAENGSLPDTSVGYKILDDGECIGAKDGLPIYKFRWMPHEASLVTIPADFSVGVGRAAKQEDNKEFQEISVRSENVIDAPKQNAKQRSSHMATATDPAEPATVDLVKERKDGVRVYREKCDRINGFVAALKNEKWKVEAEKIAKKHIAGEDPDFESFRTEALDYFEGATKIDEPKPKLGMSRKERRDFSFRRCILQMGTKGELSGLEKEVDEAATKLYAGKDNRAFNGIVIPEDMRECNLAEDNDMDSVSVARSLERIEEVMRATGRYRALSANSGPAGGYTVATDLLAGSLIELLRNKALTLQMGVIQLPGLTGNIAIPRVSGGATTYWLAEGAAVTESDQVFQQIGMVPHRLGCDTAYTLQLMNQSSIAIEAFVRDDMAKQQAVAVDAAIIGGTGNAGQPIGVLNTAGVGTVTYGGTVTWAKIVQQLQDIENANAVLGKLTWLVNPSTKGKWRQTLQVAASTFPIYIWMNNPGGPSINDVKAGLVDENDAFATVNVPAATQLTMFGCWSEVIFGTWAGINLVVDPYSLKKSEQIEVTMHQWHDVAMRHPVAMEVSTDAGNQ